MVRMIVYSCHAALKHLIVSGNAFLYMGPERMKNYPLNRFVVNRDGDGNVIEIPPYQRTDQARACTG